MIEVLAQVAPILVLMAFGFVLQRGQYFEDVAYNRLQHMVVNFVIPCMLFSSFIHMELNTGYALVSFSYFLLMILLLALGFAIYKACHIKNRFFPFMMTTFGFGTLGLPLYTTLFGAENAEYITILGVGHEFFVGLIFLPLVYMFFSGEKLSANRALRSVFNPSLVMVFLGFGIRFLGLNWLLTGNVLGIGIAGAIRYMGSLTLPLTLIMVGYRLKFNDRENIRTSFAYTAVRMVVTITVCMVFKLLVINHLMERNPLFDHAYYILLFQHSSLALTAIVGRYGSRQEHEIVNNAFAMNVIGGFLLFILYMVLFA